MFTGIIQENGKVARIEPRAHSALLVISAPRLSRKVRRGGSLAVNGVCLTVTKRVRSHLTFDISKETWDQTNFRNLAVGDLVNLEGALAFGKPVDGHFVLGHVDGTGSITRKIAEPGQVVMEVALPKKLSPLIARKGSVAIDGVSLTVSWINGQSFRVALIPHTLKLTNLSNRNVGDRVNIEVDPIARYLQKQLAHGH